MFRKLLCWLGWHKPGLVLWMDFSQTLIARKCLHCNGVVWEADVQ